MEKVKLPKDVAEAIERLGQRFSRKNILAILLKGHLTGDVYAGEYQKEVSILRSMEFDDILLALANGYEIEYEPITVTIPSSSYERIRDVYKKRMRDAQYAGHIWSAREHTAFIDGMKFVLNEINVAVDGVNA